jgi:hypothetical protein
MPNFCSQRQPSNLWQAPRIREGLPAGLWRSATRTMKPLAPPLRHFSLLCQMAETERVVQSRAAKWRKPRGPAGRHSMWDHSALK